jgi:hypothetical protein
MAGMNEESREFAGNLFDALARERGIKGDSINKAQLKEFWDQISEQSFDSRLRTFFDMLFLFFSLSLLFILFNKSLHECVPKNYSFIFHLLPTNNQ